MIVLIMALIEASSWPFCGERMVVAGGVMLLAAGAALAVVVMSSAGRAALSEPALNAMDAFYKRNVSNYLTMT